MYHVILYKSAIDIKFQLFTPLSTLYLPAPLPQIFDQPQLGQQSKLSNVKKLYRGKIFVHKHCANLQAKIKITNNFESYHYKFAKKKPLSLNRPRNNLAEIYSKRTNMSRGTPYATPIHLSGCWIPFNPLKYMPKVTCTGHTSPGQDLPLPMDRATGPV